MGPLESSAGQPVMCARRKARDSCGEMTAGEKQERRTTKFITRVKKRGGSFFSIFLHKEQINKAHSPVITQMTSLRPRRPALWHT